MKSEESLGSEGSGGGWEWVMGDRFGQASVHCVCELGLMALNMLVLSFCPLFDTITCVAMLHRVLARDTRVSVLCYVQNSHMLISSIVFQCSS